MILPFTSGDNSTGKFCKYKRFLKSILTKILYKWQIIINTLKSDPVRNCINIINMGQIVAHERKAEL